MARGPPSASGDAFCLPPSDSRLWRRTVAPEAGCAARGPYAGRTLAMSLPTPEARPDLSVVVPVYNEAESLPELADAIRAALDGAGLSFEVWLVDDGSTDGSWNAIEAAGAEDARFGGVCFRRNYGKSAALAAGFERARGRYVATLDADLQDDPAELPADGGAAGGGRRPGERVEEGAARPSGEDHPQPVLQRRDAARLGHPAPRLQQRHQGVPLRGDQERPRVRRAPPLHPASGEVGGVRADRGAGRAAPPAQVRHDQVRPGALPPRLPGPHHGRLPDAVRAAPDALLWRARHARLPGRLRDPGVADAWRSWPTGSRWATGRCSSSA